MIEPLGTLQLSTTGAFLETPLPCRIGTRLRLEIPLPSGVIVTTGLVSYRREPGDPEARQHPSGMGVVFEPFSGDALARLEDFVEETSRFLRL